MNWKKIFIWGFFLFLLIASFSRAQAATNKTWCRLNEAGQCKQKIDCNQGCVPPPLNCPSRSVQHCEIAAAPTACNCEGPGTLTCEWKKGVVEWCHRVGSCGAGYEPSPAADPCLNHGETECPNVDAGTCIQSTIPQPVPPGVACDICGCQNGAKTTTCPNCNSECYNCVYNEGKSWTAFRCLPTNDPQEFIGWLLGAVIGIAGGIAFLLMLWGGFQIITSTGDPEKLNKGKEILTSAIIGLIVIIFSVFLLKLIGVDILQLPEFEK